MAKNRGNQARLDGGERADKTRGNSSVLVLAALDMSWRLALAVLIPIIGGFELDQHLNTTPALTILGFLVAMAGVFMILKQTVAAADSKFNPKRNH